MMFDADELAAACHDALAESEPRLAVRELLERVVSQPGAIDAALGRPAAGGLRSLHRSPEITVLHIVWSPHVALFPHDHGMWAANAIYRGAEDNVYFRRRGSTIERVGGERLAAGDVGLLGERAIHAVTNPGDDFTAAIHVYGGDYFGVARSQWDASTLVERPFDVEDVRRTLAAADRRAAPAG
jgi:predicted metal-dependent enzyme (double-stranded beta helix superfamily)